MGAVGRIEVVEGNNGTTRKRGSQYAALTRHSSSGNHMIREPAASAGPQIVITDSVPAGRGVDEPAVSRIDRYVTDPATLREQHQIANGKRTRRGLDRDSRTRHLPRSSRQIDTLNSVDILNESGAIEPGSR
jgi:hypothetical protein